MSVTYFTIIRQEHALCSVCRKPVESQEVWLCLKTEAREIGPEEVEYATEQVTGPDNPVKVGDIVIEFDWSDEQLMHVECMLHQQKEGTVNEEQFRSLLHESLDRLIAKALKVYPVDIYDLQLIGTTSMQEPDGEVIDACEYVTVGEEFCQLADGTWFVEDAYQRERVD